MSVPFSRCAASVIDELLTLRPHHPVFMDRSFGSRLNSRWRLIIPTILTDTMEGIDL